MQKIIEKPLIPLLLIAAAVRLLYLFDWHDVWWDSGVYIGMGKWLWSFGAAGLWEDIRPVLWPAILGFFWKLKLNPVGFARAIMFVLSIANVYLVFRIAERVFSKRTAALTTAMFAISPIFFFLGFHEYTEIPSLFFTLAAIWLFLQEKHYWAGLLIGLAFLTRFPIAIFGIPLGIVLLWKKAWKPLARLAAGFFTCLIPFLLFSWFLYGNPLTSLVEGQRIIGMVLGCTVLRYRPWYDYFVLLWLEHYFYVLAIPAMWFVRKTITKEKMLIVLAAALPLLYFMLQPCRDYRYLLNVVPFVAMLSAFGIDQSLVFVRNKKVHSWLFVVLLVITLSMSLATAVVFYHGNENLKPDAAAEGYFTYLRDKNTTGEVWIANPIIAAYTDLSLKKIYYPVYDAGAAQTFSDYLQANAQKIVYVAIDNCGGGIICAAEDARCHEQHAQMQKFLEANFTLAYNQSTGECWYKIYQQSQT